jgi:hypothetical protein
MATKQYVIKKGNHYANGLNLKFWYGKNQLRFKGVFDASCLYNLNSSDNYDINKLYGLTFGLFNDNYSIRIGWNCGQQNGKIQLYAYFHTSGNIEPSPVYLGEVEVNRDFSIVIDLTRGIEGNIFIKLNLFKEIKINYNFTSVPNYGYYNHPYFGGNKKAPHDMYITIKTC